MLLKILGTLILATCALSCTNLVVTPGASIDGSTIFSDNGDSSTKYGSLDRYPGRKNIPPGTMKTIWNFDSGRYVTEIEEPAETYDVVGNLNEFQLSMGETTFGGLAQLCVEQPGAVMDYGNLIWTTLQRSKNAREAIDVMVQLTQTYG